MDSNNNFISMDYTFFNKPSARQKFILSWLTPVNKLFKKLGWHIEVVRRPYDFEMITVEQRINMFHLLNEILIHRVEGEVVEFGCHTGQTAMQIQSILQYHNSEKQFHVYDAFHQIENPANSFKQKFIENFNKANLHIPIIHEGLFSETIPSELPDKIAFAHIDCINTTDQAIIKETLLHLLDHLYPRMSHNAVCLIMDYYDETKTVGCRNNYPAVKEACDVFFENKPEKVYVLYGNHFPHGYFRKQLHSA